MVRLWQDMFYNKRYASTALVNPDFLKIADGFGITSKRVSERKDLERNLAEMLAADVPYLLDVTISKEANVLPMVEPGSSVSEVRMTN